MARMSPGMSLTMMGLSIPYFNVSAFLASSMLFYIMRTWVCYLAHYLKEATTTMVIIRNTFCTFQDIYTWIALCPVLLCLGAGLFYPYLSVSLRWHWCKHMITSVAMKRPWRISLHWLHNGLDGVSNHQAYHRLLSRLFGRRSKKTSKLRITGLCEFPAQMASQQRGKCFHLMTSS